MNYLPKGIDGEFFDKKKKAIKRAILKKSWNEEYICHLAPIEAKSPQK